jgi:hypothetical protein
MDASELVRLLESGDLHGLMLKVVRAWAEKYHPETKDLILLGEFGEGLPAIQVPVSLPSSSFLVSSRPR